MDGKFLQDEQLHEQFPIGTLVKVKPAEPQRGGHIWGGRQGKVVGYGPMRTDVRVELPSYSQSVPFFSHEIEAA